MNIGIITQPLRINYGGLLQNYALQQVLKKLGHEVITLDQTKNPVSKLRIVASLTKTFILKMLNKGDGREYYFQLDQLSDSIIRQHSQYFVDKYIDHTQPMFKSKDFRNYCKNNKIDLLIVGSDQVWRPIYNSYNIYRSFLDFAIGLNVKRLSYAASFGVDYWEFTYLQTFRCKRLIKLFDSISVREESGVDLCNQYFSRTAEHVLDPTMLLDKEDYEKLVYNENEPKSPGNLFTYILDDSNVKKQLINITAKCLGLEPFKVMQNKRPNRESIKHIDDCIIPPVTKWIRAFMDAKFVVCDSFHGVVFSIIFNKPFLAIGNADRGLSRFTSLLKSYGLEDRIVTSIEDDLTIIHKRIDWNKINSIRNNLKNKSYSYIKQNITL